MAGTFKAKAITNDKEGYEYEFDAGDEDNLERPLDDAAQRRYLAPPTVCSPNTSPSAQTNDAPQGGFTSGMGGNARPSGGFSSGGGGNARPSSGGFSTRLSSSPGYVKPSGGTTKKGLWNR